MENEPSAIFPMEMGTNGPAEWESRTEFPDILPSLHISPAIVPILPIPIERVGEMSWDEESEEPGIIWLAPVTP
jgi:hypothetical protein